MPNSIPQTFQNATTLKATCSVASFLLKLALFLKLVLKRSFKLLMHFMVSKSFWHLVWRQLKFMKYPEVEVGARSAYE